ncbi:hypothetical protein QPL79_00310 [Ignisphaera sp. 4213-co]|uniref:Uncharacterized protein n=1 Tax=Ignisphaera cupida TaxID=3050454 RepID=A0ABD4Z5A9_9CREN|nr:hypothetical protein [Ignisphaera sp. 4213-co]MDK6027813.1 hypothetical protein [Ignisphaera sp. 4213-co]
MGSKKKTILKILADGRIVVEEPEAGKQIDPALAFYLIYNNVADVVNENNVKIGFDEFIKRIQSSVNTSIFLVLMDLLKRGKKVSMGVSKNELVLVDEKTRILVLDEDAVINVENLYNTVDRAIKQGYKLVIAVVDMYGDVTYYEVSKMSFPKIERSGEFI